jgi:hypothetical protein
MPSRGFVRRVARGAASLAIAFAAGWGLLAGSAHAGPPAMRFTGSVNALGVLDGINLSPPSVSVPPGGEVDFVNSSGTPLTLTVGGATVSLADGQTQTVSFAGAETDSQVSASATAVGIPAAGDLTSSSGTVLVGARRAGNPAGSDPPPPPPSPVPSASPEVSADPQSPEASASAAVAGSALVPSPNTAHKTGTWRHPIAASPSAAAARGDASVDGSFAAAIPQQGTSVRGTRVTTVSGSGSLLGLLILVATVLLGGVGAAAIRSVLALRDRPRPRSS